MSVIGKIFETKKPFVGYITVGDGGLERSLEAALALVEGGVDILEIGLPFSDPIADGPVIQEAMERALKRGTTFETLINFVKRFRQISAVPLVLFSYYNPILKGGKKALEEAKQAGVDGVLIVDLPIEEGEAFQKEAKEVGLDTIFLISPSTPEERIAKIAAVSSGFLYYVCRKGTTGVQRGLPEDLEEKVKLIKSHSSLPLVVGFGISNQEMAQKVAQMADGYVVGSALVDAIGKGKSAQLLTQFTRGLAI